MPATPVIDASKLFPTNTLARRAGNSVKRHDLVAIHKVVKSLEKKSSMENEIAARLAKQSPPSPNAVQRNAQASDQQEKTRSSNLVALAGGATLLSCGSAVAAMSCFTWNLSWCWYGLPLAILGQLIIVATLLTSSAPTARRSG